MFFANAQGIEPQLFISLFPEAQESAGFADSRDFGAWSTEGQRELAQWLTTRGTTLRAHIQAWQDRYRLPDEWCAACGLATLLNQWPGPRQRVNWVIPEIPGSASPIFDMGAQQSFTWSPDFEPWDQAEARFRALVREQRDQVRMKLRAIEAAPDMPVPYRNPWHLDRLAQYTVGRTSYYKLALKYWPEDLDGWKYTNRHRSKESTIRKGVKSAAELVGLTLPTAETA